MRRVSIAIDDDLFDRIDAIPWGMKSSLIRSILEMIADGMDRSGSIFLGAVLNGEMVLRLRKEGNDGDR